ncbi:MAG: response regulator [Gemmatimonadetes bacterium]|nr:response regulator [Gemmatimonadota bacterium]
MHPNVELTPLILLVDDQEWTSKAIESILRPKGHVVLKAYTGQQALDLVRKVSPDAVLVAVRLPDFDGIDLIRRLKESPTVHATTPILVISTSSMGRAERLEALGAGAWDILTHPVDPSELILRMDTFVRSKQTADQARDDGLTDPSTGFYNVRGILRRAKEISADAARFDRPITFIAFGPGVSGRNVTGAEESDADADAEAMGRPVAAALRHVTRLSDTIGRLGPGEFVVVAPGTGKDGAVRLADRVLEAIEADARAQSPGVSTEALLQVCAGFSAVGGTDGATPEDLLLRATMALRQAQSGDGSFRVRAHEA